MNLICKQTEVIDHVATGSECRKLREKYGLTLEQVATGMGISFRYLSELERGTRKWTKERLAKFEEAVNKAKGKK